MKSILLLALSAFVINFSFGQEWSIINPNRTVFFQHSDSAYISNTIVVDSTDILGLDSTFYTGYAFKYCDTCQGFTFYEPIIYRYAKELLGFSITHSSTHQNYILDEDTIYHHAQLSDSWDFNASQTATVLAVGETSILGVTDSIKTIELSTNDTIILSKNYGAIRYPDFENSGAYYEMVGYHEGQNSFGDYLPNFWRTYDFNVGDVFCYETVYENTGIWIFEYNNVELKILENLSNGDTIKYKVRRLVSGYSHGDQTVWPPAETTYHAFSGIFEFSIINHSSLIENTFGVQEVSGEIYNNSDYIFYKNGIWAPRYYEPYLASTFDGNIRKTYNVSTVQDSTIEIDDVFYYAQYEENKGLVWFDFYGFENHVKSEQVGSIINGDTTGTIFNYPDDLGLKTVESSKVLNVYPNPTHDNIYLPQAFKTVSIFTTLGQKVLEVKTGDLVLDVSTLPKGIYLIQAVDQNGMVYQSKIVKN